MEEKGEMRTGRKRRKRRRRMRRRRRRQHETGRGVRGGRGGHKQPPFTAVWQQMIMNWVRRSHYSPRDNLLRSLTTARLEYREVRRTLQLFTQSEANLFRVAGIFSIFVHLLLDSYKHVDVTLSKLLFFLLFPPFHCLRLGHRVHGSRRPAFGVVEIVVAFALTVSL